MKKLWLIASFGLLNMISQAQSFQKNDIILLGGIGKSLIPAPEWITYQGFSNYHANILPILTIKGEIALSDDIGIGISSAWSSANARWNYNNILVKSTFNKLTITPRLNIHFVNKEKIDMYFGGGIGYKTGGYTFNSTDPNFVPSTDFQMLPISMEAFLGIRTYFTSEFGGFAELGLGNGFFNFGFVFKPLLEEKRNQ